MNVRTGSLLLFSLFACEKPAAAVAKTEPTKTEPAKTEPAKAEPATPEPATAVERVKPIEPTPPPAAEPQPAAEDDFALMTGESFGELKLGMTETELTKLLPGAKKGKCELSEASGDRVRFLQAKAAGVQLAVSCETAKDVLSVRVFAPSKLKSKRGIGIGDTADAVKKAYGDSLDPQSEPDEHNIVAGSVYGGLGFTLKDGKVTEMFLGAMAE